jgi:hypothetical protein
MPRALLLAPLLLLVLAGCDPASRALFNPEPSPAFRDDERKAVDAEIRHLAKGKDPADIDASATYSETVQKLTGRGSKIEPALIEALAGNQDWAVRMGVIEVLESVGTKACIDAVIAATADPAPLVALHANTLLEAMTGHRVIPAAGSPPSAEGLPPVPKRDPGDLALDAEEKLWAAWQQQNGKLLNATWAAWWKANRATAKVN